MSINNIKKRTLEDFEFRVWIEVSNELGGYFEYASDLTDIENIVSNINKKTHIMQFTGFVDKNSRKIYEGDIIKTYNYYNGDTLYNVIDGIVVHENGEFFILSCLDNKTYFNLFDLANNTNLIVRGDIYTGVIEL